VFVTAAMELRLFVLKVAVLKDVSKVTLFKVAGFKAVFTFWEFTITVEPPLVQAAAPDASRAQVVPAGQQKLSPGQSMSVGLTHPEMVVQILPTGQQPTSLVTAVKQVKPVGQQPPLEQQSAVPAGQQVVGHAMSPAGQQNPDPQIFPAGQHWVLRLGQGR